MIYEPFEQITDVWKGTTCLSSIVRVYTGNLTNTLIVATPTFSNVGYQARSLAEFKDQPAVIIENSDPVLEDSVVDELFEKVGEIAL